MTSIDELFKKPLAPSNSFSKPSNPTKRKFESPNAEEVYKAAKLSANGSPSSRPNGATVEDEPEDDDDVEAGPAPPPDEDEDDDEDGGRFFGGGVTRDAAEALDYIDQQDGEEFTEERIDSAWLRRLVVTLDRKVSKNAELRARFEGQPQKFMASEADLDAEIKSWSLLAEHAELYPELAKHESVATLVGLLAHENTDVAIGVVEILAELVDEDVEAEAEQWQSLVDAMLEADLLDLLMSNLERLDEANESDREGVYHSLSVLESLASQQAIAERIGEEKVLMYLCNRIALPEKPLGQNKQYAAELLQILLQTSPLLRKRLALDFDGVDLFLRLLSGYRKRDPEKDSLEEEFAENVFDALTCVVDEADGKLKFLEAEGVELCLIMLKEGTFSKLRALRLLDHAVGGQSTAAGDVCEKVVDAGGLKVLFRIFMAKKADSGTTEHLLGIFSALLRLLPGESPSRIRMLAKFEEKDHEKLGRLLDLRKEYTRKLQAVDQEIALEKRMIDDEEAEERADEIFSRRLDGGLYCLQTINVVVAWLAAEDGGMKSKMSEVLGSLKEVKTSLQEQLNILDPQAAEDEDMRDMLATLVGFLE